ncbi:fibronectin type III domain-containing protein [Thermomonospora umbrina]|uniref:fibronectin type III domain-containing protein n=1 Tax=Thermomonospora umbrina TaxID=111806 RepID=UPI0014768711|nr:fibronectin type III domain-containing protein [Thermomonospora umbrina]
MEKNVTYICDYPLLGLQTLTAKVTANFPDRLAAGTATGPMAVTVDAQIPAETTEGLAMLGAAKMTAQIRADARAYTPDSPTGVNATTGLTVGETAIPASGAFPVKATGNTPSFKSVAAGWAKVNIGNITMRVTPMFADGSQTPLGVMNVTCYQKLADGETNTLHQWEWTPASGQNPPKPAADTWPQPAAPAYGDNPHPRESKTLDLDYTCEPYPIISEGGMHIKATAAFPKTVDLKTNTGRTDFTSQVTLDKTTMVGLASLSEPVTHISAGVTIDAPAEIPEIPDPGTMTAKLGVKVPELPVPPPPFIPEDAEPWTIPVPITGSVPSFLFRETGPGKMSLGSIKMRLVAKKAGGGLHPDLHDPDPQNPGQLLPYRSVNCTLNAGQTDTTIASFNITDGGPPPVDTTAPSVPEGVTATKGADGKSAEVKWNASTDTGANATGVGGYDIFVNDEATPRVSAGAADTTVTVPNLTPGSYTFKVRAFDKANPRNNSAASSATSPAIEITAPDPDLPAPGNFKGTVVAGQTGVVDLSWDAVPGATKYVVTGNGETKEVTDPAAQFTGVPVGSHEFSVVAKSATKTSPAATVTVVIPPAGDLAAPGNFKGTVAENGTVNLTWDAVTGATKYVVTGNGETKEVTDPAAQFTGVPVGSHEFSVVAKDDTRTSAPATTTVEVKDEDPVLSAPANFKGVQAQDEDGAADLSWDAVAGATGYVVTWAGGSQETDQTTVRIKGLSVGSHDFSIVAKNATQTSSPAATTVVIKGDEEVPAPTNVKAGTPTTNSIPLTWDAVEGTTYEVYNGELLDEGNIATGSHTVDGLNPDTPYTLSVVAVKDGKKSQPTPVTARTAKEQVVVDPVTELVGTPGKTTVDLSWKGSEGVTYEVHQNGQPIKDGLTTPAFQVTGLSEATKYTFTVFAVKGGVKSEGTSIDVTTLEGELAAPANLRGGEITTSSIQVLWDVVAGVTYEVTANGKTEPGTGGKYTATGLNPDTEYEFKVVAKKNGQTSAASTIKLKTKPVATGGDFNFSLAGSSSIKAANGTVPLSGSIAGKLTGGDYTGALKLNNTKGNFRIMGFIPTTADITFTQNGQTTGTLSGTTLTSNSKMVVGLKSVKVFGIQIGGGDSCKTTSPVDIKLKSTNFSLAGGGDLAGTYTLPSVSGCGLLTPLISGMTAGPGNTVNVKATPAK